MSKCQGFVKFDEIRFQHSLNRISILFEGQEVFFARVDGWAGKDCLVLEGFEGYIPVELNER